MFKKVWINISFLNNVSFPGLKMGLEKVMHEKREIVHEDYRRTIITAFNGEERFGGCKFKQSKFLYVKSQDVVLGGHYHEYAELYYLNRGEAHVTLEDVETRRREQIFMAAHDVLFIPAKVAHKVWIQANSELVGYTEECYVSAEENDMPYEIR